MGIKYASGNSILRKLFIFLIPVLFFILVVNFIHFDKAFEYEPDEGIYLSRAYLYNQGYVLYKDIWMDAQPMLVMLLAGIIKIFGPSIFYARALSLIFSSLLIWGLFKIISKTQNSASALFALGLLAFSSFYLKLSVSAMPGIPAVAMATLSAYCIVLYRQNKQKRYLLLSGCLLAIALQLKFFVIIFLPAILGEIIIAEISRRRAKALRSSTLAITLWLIALASVYLYVAFIMTSLDFSQMTQPYIIMRSKMQGVFPGRLEIMGWMLQDCDIVLLAIGAVIFWGLGQGYCLFVPLSCFLLAAAIFSNHHPVWYHHRILITPSLCWLASFGFYKFFNKNTWSGWIDKSKARRIKDIAAILFFSFALALTIARVPMKYKRIINQTEPFFSDDQRNVLEIMRQYRGSTHLVVTDRPIFAFYAGLPVHPYLATPSLKRLASGLLKSKDFINIIRKERPELVVLERFPELKKEIVPCLEGSYKLAYRSKDGLLQLYILNK